jgi:hypothetical protein
MVPRMWQEMPWIGRSQCDKQTKQNKKTTFIVYHEWLLESCHIIEALPLFIHLTLPWMTGVVSCGWKPYLLSFHLTFPWTTGFVSDGCCNPTSFHSSDISMNVWSHVIWMKPYLFHQSYITMNEWLESCHTYLKPTIFSSIWHSNNEWPESCHMDENLAIFTHLILLL